jgi:hypothetical protein
LNEIIEVKTPIIPDMIANDAVVSATVLSMHARVGAEETKAGITEVSSCLLLSIKLIMVVLEDTSRKLLSIVSRKTIASTSEKLISRCTGTEFR